MAGAHAHDVATVIDRQGVAVRAGTHCAKPLLATLRRDVDLPRFIRRSTTRWAEVDKLAEALQKAEALFA